MRASSLTTRQQTGKKKELERRVYSEPLVDKGGGKGEEKPNPQEKKRKTGPVSTHADHYRRGKKEKKRFAAQ